MSEPIKSTDFESILNEIMAGKRDVPNFEELPLAKGIANIAAGGGLKDACGVRNAKIPGSKSSWGHWARYFLGTTQGGALDGTGYLIWWANSDGHVGRFAICKHECTATGTREQSRRGWNPGYCSHCGLDMSVDSGD